MKEQKKEINFDERAKINRPTTAEDFEKWYKKTNNDPWFYNSSNVQNRLNKSIAFISKYLKSNYEGVILDIGAFNGYFTNKLIKYFKESQIVVNDFSETALNLANINLINHKRVKFLHKNMLNINKNDIQIFNENGGVVITLLECLYYLPSKDREKAISNLIIQFNKPQIFISAPITGPPYFYEYQIIKMFNKYNYYLVEKEVLNYTYKNFNKLINKLIYNRISRHCFKFLYLKRTNQVIYFFKSKNNNKI